MQLAPQQRPRVRGKWVSVAMLGHDVSGTHTTTSRARSAAGRGMVVVVVAVVVVSAVTVGMHSGCPQQELAREGTLATM